MLDAEARTLLDLMEKAIQEGGPKINALPYAEGRAAVNKMLKDSAADPPRVAAVEDGVFAGPGGKIGYRRYRPLGTSNGSMPTLIFYHGGGFIAGNLDTHDSTCRRLANGSRCQVIAIDYRLAPEHPFPAALDDVLAAWRAFAAAHPGRRIVVAGDSAGGNLALVTAMRARDEDLPLPAAIALMSPLLDLTFSGPSFERNDGIDPMLRAGSARRPSCR